MGVTREGAKLGHGSEGAMCHLKPTSFDMKKVFL
jgi:hypothetical protein